MYNQTTTWIPLSGTFFVCQQITFFSFVATSLFYYSRRIWKTKKVPQKISILRHKNEGLSISFLGVFFPTPSLLIPHFYDVIEGLPLSSIRLTIRQREVCQMFVNFWFFLGREGKGHLPPKSYDNGFLFA